MNSVVLYGRLVRDPELKKSDNDVNYLLNTIAVRRHYKNSQTGEYDSDFLDVIAYGYTAKALADYTKKGDRVVISGQLQSYKDKNNHTKMQVSIDRFDFVEYKGDEKKVTEGEIRENPFLS